MPLMVKDYRGHHRTSLPAYEINLIAHTVIILIQIIQPDMESESKPRKITNQAK